jgi:hypothetical protein
MLYPLNSTHETFQPDWSNVLAVLENQRPARLPRYEHYIDLPFISKALTHEIATQCALMTSSAGV